MLYSILMPKRRRLIGFLSDRKPLFCQLFENTNRIDAISFTQDKLLRLYQNNYLDAASKGASELAKCWGAEDETDREIYWYK